MCLPDYELNATIQIDFISTKGYNSFMENVEKLKEKMELSIAELAKAVDLPEYIEEDIENGETYFLHKYVKTSIVPQVIGAAIPGDSNIQLNENHCVEAKKWWESCEEYELREEVWKYLYVNCAPLNVTRRNFRYTNFEFSEYINIELKKDDHRYEFDELKAGDIFAIHNGKSNAIEIYIVQIDQNGHMHGISLENGDAVLFKGNSEVTKYIKKISLSKCPMFFEEVPLPFD